MKNNGIGVYMQVMASEVMTKQVVSVEPETTIGKIIDLMTKHKISGIPVVDDKKMLVGIVSEKDIFAFSAMNVIPYINTAGWLSPNADDTNNTQIYHGIEIIANTEVKDLMNAKVICVNENTSLLEVAKKMEKKGINRVPVVNKAGELSGIIARQDITNYMRKGLETISVMKKGLDTVSMIMTKDVVSVEPDATLDKAIKLMAKFRVSGIPVVENNNGLVGMVSERDIIHFTSFYGGIPNQAAHIISAIKSSGWLPPGAEEDLYYSPIEIMSSKKVKCVMSLNAISVKEDTPILNVVEMMEANNINRIPVVNTKGELSGIATRQDLVNYLAQS